MNMSPSLEASVFCGDLPLGVTWCPSFSGIFVVRGVSVLSNFDISAHIGGGARDGLARGAWFSLSLCCVASPLRSVFDTRALASRAEKLVVGLCFAGLFAALADVLASQDHAFEGELSFPMGLILSGVALAPPLVCLDGVFCPGL